MAALQKIDLPLPEDLHAVVDRALADRPAASWRAAVERVAEEVLAAQGQERGSRSTEHEGPPEPGSRGQTPRRGSELCPNLARGTEREAKRMRECASDRRSVVRHRTVDTLGKMLRAGSISQEMHDAAKDFQAAFIVAQLDPRRAMPVLRVRGTGHEPHLSECQIDARRPVQEALQALGGLSSPAGSCVWHVVGLQRSVREWGWGGRPVRQEQAQGILTAALGMLAGHLGYADAKRAS